MDNYGFIDAGSFSCDKSSACCFTGHRRRSLPCGGDPSSAAMKKLESELGACIKNAYDDGYRSFISGMADGIDLCCAEIVLSMKRSGRYDGIRLICALPYPDQYDEMKTDSDMYLYRACLKGCDEAVLVSPSFSKGCYRERNLFMVEHSSRIICVYSPLNPASGTMQTVRFAEQSGIDIVRIDLVGFGEILGT